MSGNLKNGNLTDIFELYFVIPGAIDKMEQQFKDMRDANHRGVLEAPLMMDIILAHHSYLYAVEQKQVRDPFGWGLPDMSYSLVKAFESLRHTWNRDIKCVFKNRPDWIPPSSIISDLNLHQGWVKAKAGLWNALVGFVELVGELSHVNHGVSEEDRKRVETILRIVGPELALRPSRSACASAAANVANRHAVSEAARQPGAETAVNEIRTETERPAGSADTDCARPDAAAEAALDSPPRTPLGGNSVSETPAPASKAQNMQLDRDVDHAVVTRQTTEPAEVAAAGKVRARTKSKKPRWTPNPKEPMSRAAARSGVVSNILEVTQKRHFTINAGPSVLG